MSGNYWIKFYCEVLDDPKMATLPDRLWRRFYELCLLAGKQNKDGLVPPVNQIAWSLRVEESQLTDDLNELVKLGLIAATHDGYLVVNFAKRQEKMSNTERQAKFRERLHKDEYYSNENVTARYAEVSHGVRQITDNREQITETDVEADVDIDDNDISITFNSLYPGLQPRTDKDKSAWNEAFVKLKDAGITPDIMRKAARELKEKDYKIAGPPGIVTPCMMTLARDETRIPDSLGKYAEYINR